MLVEIIDKKIRYSYVIRIHDYIANKLKNLLPFETTLRVWKEEVYLSTPLKLEEEPSIYRIELGKVYYWPPESSICLFYGISEPYTPVIFIGDIVGPLHYLKYVSDGDNALVREHEVSPEFRDYVKELEAHGYDVATPLHEDRKVIYASKDLSEGKRLAFTIFIEDYGYHIESEALVKYLENMEVMKLVKSLKSDVAIRSKYLRLDINEDGYLVITAGLRKKSELFEAVKELETVYPYVLTHVYAI